MTTGADFRHNIGVNAPTGTEASVHLAGTGSNTGARAYFGMDTRNWSAGVLGNGTFQIADETAGTYRMLIDLGGTINFNGNLGLTNNSIGISFARWSTNSHGLEWRTVTAAGVGACAYHVDDTDAGFLLRSDHSGNTALYYVQLDGANGRVIAYYAGGTPYYVYWPVTFSDRRLKSNIQPATKDALDVVRRINVYEADVPTSPLPDAQSLHWDYTLMADEMADLIPAAYLAPEDNFATIRELPVIATLVRAVQQLADRVDALGASHASH
jgi:hypothetical protein